MHVEEVLHLMKHRYFDSLLKCFHFLLILRISACSLLNHFSFSLVETIYIEVQLYRFSRKGLLGLKQPMRTSVGNFINTAVDAMLQNNVKQMPK